MRVKAKKMKSGGVVATCGNLKPHGTFKDMGIPR
jgi:hypothetical protein